MRTREQVSEDDELFLSEVEASAQGPFDDIAPERRHRAALRVLAAYARRRCTALGRVHRVAPLHRTRPRDRRETRSRSAGGGSSGDDPHLEARLGGPVVS
jgi:hypothetical protein